MAVYNDLAAGEITEQQCINLLSWKTFCLLSTLRVQKAIAKMDRQRTKTSWLSHESVDGLPYICFSIPAAGSNLPVQNNKCPQCNLHQVAAPHQHTSIWFVEARQARPDVHNDWQHTQGVLNKEQGQGRWSSYLLVDKVGKNIQDKALEARRRIQGLYSETHE